MSETEPSQSAEHSPNSKLISGNRAIEDNTKIAALAMQDADGWQKFVVYAIYLIGLIAIIPCFSHLMRP